VKVADRHRVVWQLLGSHLEPARSFGIGQVVPTITTFTDNAAPAGATVRYRVVVFTGSVESPPSEVVTVVTPRLDPLRDAPDDGGIGALLS
jgi:hypothetical protein